MGPSLVKLYDKLESNKDKIPPGVTPALVKPKGVDDVPTVTLTLWSDIVDDSALRLIGLEVMQRLKEVRNTSQNFLVGGRSEQVRIEVEPQLLRGYGIGIGQVAQVIRAANQKKDVGSVEAGGTSFTVYTGSFLRGKEDIDRLLVGVSRGAPVYIRDIAKVTEGPGEATSIVQYYSGPGAHFEPDCGILCSIKRSVTGYEAPVKPKLTYGASAVTIAIAKKSGTNGVKVSSDILDKIEFLKGRIIPDNVHVEVTRDYGKSANDKVNQLLGDMALATLMVTFLIYVFLGVRPTFVVATVIPVIILITVFAAWMLEFTIDRVSLFALIFCIGILVDDATVVVENIYRRWLLKGSVDTATTIDAVREVGNPTVLATLAIIAALLPMGMVSGMMGPYMAPIPVLGSVAMIFSVYAAFIFTPWLAIRVRPSLRQLNAMQDKEHKTARIFDGFFRKVLEPMIDNPKRATMFRMGVWGVFMLACSMFYFQGVAVKMLPLDNKSEFNIVVNMPEGTALPVTANVVQRLTDALLRKEGANGKPALHEVTAVQSYAGTASPFNFNGLVRHYYLRKHPWEADLQIQLLDKADRERSSHQIAEAARALLTPIAKTLGAKIQVVEMPPGPPVLQSMVAEVYGPDDATRKEVVKKITEAFEAAPGVVDVDNYVPAPHNAWVFVIDRQKADHNGVSMADITSQLAMVMGDFKLGDVKRGRELEPRFIILQAPLAVRSQVSRLGELPIQTKTGKMIPLSALGKFVEQPLDRVIYHKDLRDVEYVTGETSGVITGLAAPIYGMLEVQKYLYDYIPPGNKEGMWPHYFGAPANSFVSSYEWTGEWTVTFETFRDMGGAFMLALILIYMLMVYEFGNFRLPGIIMAPIPLTLIGIIPGHWLLGAEFTATSMIGWIALDGIIVRNSILLVDFSKNEVERGVSLREAVIKAVVTRTRPILITQLTMIAGAFSIIGDPIFQGMAISLMFGAIVSTVLTLFIIPLACVKAPGAYELPVCETDEEVANAVLAKEAAVAEGASGAAAVKSARLDEIRASLLDDRTGGNAGASANTAGKAEKSGKPGAASAIVGGVLGAIAGLMQSPLSNIKALPYFIWLSWGQLAKLVRAKLTGDRLQGDASGEGSSRETVSDGARVIASEEGRPGKLVKSALESDVEESEAGSADKGEKSKQAKAKAKQAKKVKKVKKAKKAEKALKAEAKKVAKAQQKKEAKAQRKANEERASKRLEQEKKADAIKSKQSKPLKPPQEKISTDKVLEEERPADVTADDLKEINGIGPKLEKILNELGVTTFSQLSKLDVNEIIEAEDGMIDLAGRIEREDWVGQARKLMRKGPKKAK